MKIENGKYVIYTHSMKRYPDTVNRFMFVDDNKRYYIFDNSNYEVLNRGGKVVFDNPPIKEG